MWRSMVSGMVRGDSGIPNWSPHP